ncbi:MAG TPA: FAD-dependent oxidoreductase [Sphingomicrobium sp.]|nr:FAD-dependent oxidoreductase [Sphingomicrobium sp.]
MAFTRRALLEQVGAVGGAGAVYLAMEALGLAIPTPAGAENFQLSPTSGTGRSVVVLGAGIAGLVSAYELGRAGYKVIVLEARDRAGGRAWTIRGGDTIVQTGRPDQHSTLSPGLYFNAGPARIPSGHRVILGYARRLGVKLETFVNVNRNAGWDFGGKVQPERRMVEDMRGHIAEMLAKAIDRHALDQQVPKGELELIRQFLAPYASVGPNGVYVPQGSSGYAVEGGGYDRAPVPLPRLPFSELAPSQAVVLPYLFEHIWDMQATMLQPVGGMDRIARALYEQVKPTVRLRAPVTAIRRVGDRVRIEHGPGRQMTEADYCVCTLGSNLLEKIPNDFSPAKQAALKGVNYLPSVKVAFESPRFWETDEHIYGGLAWTDRANENVIYPSNDFGAARGVLVAAYVAGWTNQDNPQKFAGYSDAERLRVSRESVEALHPGRSRLLTKGLSVGWGLVPYSEGVGAIWPGGLGGGGSRGAQYAELLKPEGPIVFAGEHLSYQGLWQEGAAMSAHEAVKLVAAMAQARTGAQRGM